MSRNPQEPSFSSPSRLNGSDASWQMAVGEAHTEPVRDEASPTRRSKRRSSQHPSGATSAPPSMKSGSGVAAAQPFELSVEALRNDEKSRLRVTAQVMMGMTFLGLLLAPIMGGNPVARRIFVAGMITAFSTMAFLYRVSYRERENLNLVGAGGVMLAIVNACALYYMGTFSLATMTGGLGLYIFCLGGNLAWCLAVYAALAVPHGVLAGLIMFKEIPDLGLVSASDLPFTDQLALQGCAQAVYALALLAGRRTRRKLELVFGDLEKAARLISQRDALLNEAKRELERAVCVGGEGRFTDQTVGSFRLGNVIGRGGMGEVYDALHLETNEPAAVKLLQRNLFADPSSVIRFAREARAVASLESPHVVRVLEVPEERGTVPYLAMERLRGEDLASMLRREQRLSPRELVSLAQQVGAGIDDARAAGVIHRDIKPQNLFLARREHAASTWKILDFGVSKLVGQHSLTRDQLVGTPDYMAPEQAAGKEIDHQVDLYGLAAVLYRCLASRAPFTAKSVATLLHKVIYQMPPRPSSLARVSSDVEAFLAIGLSKTPGERFESGAELAEAFRCAVDGNLAPPLRLRAERILERTPWAEA